ncbi:MAG TPA: CSLREA domain-containing protein [bacterium]|nr:CSLREA domain-containing protein [bacterium]
MKKVFALSTALLALWSTELTAATITVSSASDAVANDGVCTLREAITAANSNTASGAAAGECPAGTADDTIAFAIGSGAVTIAPTSTLPDIDDGITIDGTTQPGYAGMPIVELNGTGAVAPGDWGLRVNDAVTILSLVINRFPGTGIIIGGSTADAVVQGNFIGTDVSGTADLGNGGHGISLGGQNAVIGGPLQGQLNLISGNAFCGIHVVGSQATGNRIETNFIGTDISATAALPNDLCGIVINNGANGNTVGLSLLQHNVISGNGGNGVEIGGGLAGTDDNEVLGNFIGTSGSGASALPNAGMGILVRDGAIDNHIGGEGGGEGNIIAFNGDRGIGFLETAATGNRILSNLIHSNGGLGIDLSNDDVTANDAGDVDVGPNGLQNFPILTLADDSSGSDVLLEGTFNGPANSDFRLQFFVNDNCDPSGFGEGQALLGTADVTTDGSGNATFSQTFAVPFGGFFTATATNLVTGDTSEFSPCLAGSSAPAATPTPTPTAIPTPSATPSASASPTPTPDLGDNVALSGGGCSLGQAASSFGAWPMLLLLSLALLRRRSAK